MFSRQTRAFLSSTSLELEAYPAHNEAIASDSLFSIQLNYKWRKLLAALLDTAWQNDMSTISLDNQDLLSALILDLYDAENIGHLVLTRTLNVDLITNPTVTSTTFVVMANSGFNHTFTKANALIRCMNLLLSNSGPNTTTAEIRLSGVAGTENAQAINLAATAREFQLSARFAAIATGISKGIGIQWKVSAGTGTASSLNYLVWEIIEYD